MNVTSAVTSLYPALAAMEPPALESLAMAAEKWLVKTLGRHVSPGTYTETFDGLNNPLLFVSSPPVKTVLQVTISSQNHVTTYTPESGYYQWTKDGRIHIRPQTFWNQLPGWRPGVANVQVTYTSCGLCEIERDNLIGSVMNWWYDQSNRSGLVSSESIGDYSYVMKFNITSVPPSVRTVLHPYIRFMAG